MEHRNERRLLLAVRIDGYEAGTGLMQAAMQKGLAAVLDQAAARTGLDRASWRCRPSGDGELAVLPPSEPEPRVTDHYVRQLGGALLEHNRLVAAGARLRLRLAIHFGPVNDGAIGLGGSGPVVVCRLRDSTPVRQALRGTDADLVVIASGPIFDDTIAEQLTTLEADDLCRVTVERQDAWIWTPGHSLDGIDLSAADPEHEDAGTDGAGDGRTGDPPGAGESGNFAGATIRGEHVKVAGRDIYIHHYGGRE